MPSAATKRRPPAAAAAPPAEAKKKAPPARRATGKEVSEEEETTQVQPASKKQRRSIVGVGVDASAAAPIAGKSNKEDAAAAPRPLVKDPYDFDDVEEAKSLSPAGAAGSPRFLSGLLESARKMKGKVNIRVLSSFL